MKNLFLLVIALTCLNVFAFPSKEEVLIFADLLDEHLLTRKDNLRYNDARLLEFLLYKDRIISKSLESSNHYYKKFSGERRLNIYKDSKKIVYKRGYNGRKLTIEASFKNNKVTFSISKRRDSIVKDNVIDMTSLDEDYFELISQKIYDIVQMRKGYDGFQAQNNVALNAKGDVTLQDSTEGKSTLLRIKEKVIRDSNYDNNEWKYVPIKLVSYPAQKIMYEIPELFTGLAIESVTRSPLHNIQGAGDEAKGAGKSFLNGFKDLFRGIVKPKKASSIDGLLTIVDGGFKVVKAGVNVAKSAISIVGYPLYRIFGGKKSKRVPLRGKRATVVVIDTGIDGGTVDDIVDTYGETIIRNQLKSISSYYCLNSNAEPNNIENCIDQMPDDIEYVDFFALTHSGGDSMIERLAIYAAETKGVKPELMVSIGCYDDPSFLVEKENTVGQEATQSL